MITSALMVVVIHIPRYTIERAPVSNTVAEHKVSALYMLVKLINVMSGVEESRAKLFSSP